MVRSPAWCNAVSVLRWKLVSVSHWLWCLSCFCWPLLLHSWIPTNVRMHINCVCYCGLLRKVCRERTFSLAVTHMGSQWKVIGCILDIYCSHCRFVNLCIVLHASITIAFTQTVTITLLYPLYNPHAAFYRRPDTVTLHGSELLSVAFKFTFF